MRTAIGLAVVAALAALGTQVVAGRLKVTAVTDKSACDGINFNPLVLPTGIEGSDDPLLAARAGSYAVSQARRLAK